MGKLLKHVNKACELVRKQVLLKQRAKDLDVVLRQTIRLWRIPRDKSGSNQSAVVV